MNRILRKRTLFSLIAFGTYVAVGACSSTQPGGSSSEVPANAGTIGLELTVGGATVNTIHYEIVGPTNKSGDIDVSSSTTISAFVGGLAAGSGYNITLTAVSTDGTMSCLGQATFTVVSNTTVGVPVILACKKGRNWGSVDIGGVIDFCPTVNLSANPLSVVVGSNIALTATATSGDGGAPTFKYTSTAGGAFANDAVANTAYTCGTAGTKTITLTVTDNGCATTATATVTCTATANGSNEAAYIVPSIPGVVIKPIFTAGQSVNNKPDGVTPYRMVGIPDGLGAFDNGDGTFTMLSNHEIGSATGGIVRAHGGKGAFVSRWIIRKSDLAVQHGEDLMQQVALWNATTTSYNAPTNGPTIAFGRFCSADLPAISALYDAPSGLGFNGRLFFNGEETGVEGRAMAHGLDGISYEMPRFGKQSWENSVANPATGVTTVVALDDDSTPGQVFFYFGTKTNTGTPFEKAGLTNGSLWGLQVTGVATEDVTTGIPSGTAVTLFNLGNVENLTGATLEANANTALVTRFQRPEDGAWDPLHTNDYYFVTTASLTTPSRLWRVRFNNAADPNAGGTIDMLLDGTEGQKMFDNLTIDKKGHVYLVEDVGNDARLGKTWRYTIATDTLTEIAHNNPIFFDGSLGTSNSASFYTIDEEASGIIDAADILGPGWLLVDVQNHKASTDAELFEGGQFLAIFDPAGATP
jgi:hypothetical protein